jgi:hypothetical protein
VRGYTPTDRKLSQPTRAGTDTVYLTEASRIPWHAMTWAEFVVVDRGAFTAEQLAAMSARMYGHKPTGE